MKLATKDCHNVQNDLDRFATWRTTNGTSVNADKGMQISFVCKHYPLPYYLFIYQYIINVYRLLPNQILKLKI